jgi:hypothetical protein
MRIISRCKEGENDAAALSKFHPHHQNKKDDGQTDKKPNSLVCKISKFKNSILTPRIHKQISGASHCEKALIQTCRIDWDIPKKV